LSRLGKMAVHSGVTTSSAEPTRWWPGQPARRARNPDGAEPRSQRSDESASAIVDCTAPADSDRNREIAPFILRGRRPPNHGATGRRVDGSTEEIFGGRGAEGNSSYTEVERGEIPLYSDGAAALSGLGRYPAGGGGQEECPCVRSQAISPRASFRNPPVEWRRRARGSCTAIPADRGGQSDSSLTAGGQDRLSGSRRGSWR
jgi:hypothetical protein